MKLPISTIVLTYNEEKGIEDCLKSVCSWSDEIIVVDSGSTDRTLDIVKKYTDKIYNHLFQNYGQQRNWAQERIPLKNSWILHLDADERVSHELVLELKKLFSAGACADGFMMSRRTFFREKWIRHGGHYPVYHLRLFKKDKGRCEERLYDQHFVLSTEAIKIKGDIINIIEPDLKLLKIKQKRWALFEAQEILSDRHERAGAEHKRGPIRKRVFLKEKVYYRLPLFIRPFLYFFYRYIIRFGFLDGIEGTIFHFWQGFWFRMLVDIEIIRLRRTGA